MSDYFLDTSALVKHYHSEKGTDEVDKIWNNSTSRLFISALSNVEALSAFAIKVRSGTVTNKEFDLLRQRFYADVANLRFLCEFVHDDHYKNAEQLICRYGLKYRLRTLDALQLSVAVVLRNKGTECQYITADLDLFEIANLEGFSVFNPGN